MRVVFYISGHGFGHASRDTELILALLARRRSARVLVRTSAAARLFEPLAGFEGVSVEWVETDTGITQIDSVTIDEDDTVRRAAQFYAAFDDHVGREAVRLEAFGADIVVGDVPPLAFAAAARAGVPSIAVANFTWDWIYSVYAGFDRSAPAVMPAIRGAYRQATRVLRLPLHGGFESMAVAPKDIPFIARESRRDPAETRTALGLRTDRPSCSIVRRHGCAVDRRCRAIFTLIDPRRGAAVRTRSSRADLV